MCRVPETVQLIQPHTVYTIYQIAPEPPIYQIAPEPPFKWTSKYIGLHTLGHVLLALPAFFPNCFYNTSYYVIACAGICILTPFVVTTPWRFCLVAGAVGTISGYITLELDDPGNQEDENAAMPMVVGSSMVYVTLCLLGLFYGSLKWVSTTTK